MPRNSFSSPKPIFRGRVIAAAGPLPDKNTVESFKNWTKLRKGEFRTTFDERVTHLLCSEEQFNADNAIGSMTPTQAPAMLAKSKSLLTADSQKSTQAQVPHRPL